MTMRRLLLPCLFLCSFSSPVLADRQVSVPVAATALRAGTVLGASDFDSGTVTDAQLRSGIVTRAADLIGKEVKRSIMAGQPVRMFDIKEPDVVRKGELVTLSLIRGGMAIAAVGRALDSGPRGATVRVQNATSKIIVEGEVSAQGSVRVRQLPTPDQLAAR